MSRDGSATESSARAQPSVTPSLRRVPLVCTAFDPFVKSFGGTHAASCCHCWPLPRSSPRRRSRWTRHPRLRDAGLLRRPGKLDALNARFRDHTMRSCSRARAHQRRVLRAGRREQGQQARVLDLGPEQGARDKSFKAFGMPTRTGRRSRPRARRTAGSSIKVEARVPDRHRLLAGHSSSRRGRTACSSCGRTPATKGNLGNLNDRFKNHTLKLFEKHGMTNVVYWNVLKGEGGRRQAHLPARSQERGGGEVVRRVPQGPRLARGPQGQRGRRRQPGREGRREERVPQADRLLAAEVSRANGRREPAGERATNHQPAPPAVRLLPLALPGFR